MPTIPARVSQILLEPYEFKFSEYFSRGIEIFKKEAGLYIGYSVILIVIYAISSFIPMATAVLAGPLTAGYYLVSRKISKGESVVFGDFFKGFDDFVQLLINGIVSGIIIVLGFICLIIPGIYLAVGYGFAVHLIVFEKLEFWDAMETSRKLISQQWFNFFGFAICTGLLAMSGFLLLGVGIFVTMPMAMCVSYAAFEDILQLNNDRNPDDIILDHLVDDGDLV